METETPVSRRHPLFGHLIGTHCPHHDHPYSLKGPQVHVRAVINEVLPDGHSACASHQRLMLDIVDVYDVQGGDATVIRQDETFCAIHYGGDHDGLDGPIEWLSVGEEIELKGEYLDITNFHWHPSERNEDLPVLHFVHRPHGFVKYHGEVHQ